MSNLKPNTNELAQVVADKLNNTCQICHSKLEDSEKDVCQVCRVNLMQDHTPSMYLYIKHIGKKYGKLTILEKVGSSKNNQTKVKCLCDCGKESIHILTSIVKGQIVSCGCFRKELSRAKAKKHLTYYGIQKGILNKIKNNKPYKTNTSGFIGVTFCKQTGCWVGQIIVDGKNKEKKRFPKKSQAIAHRKYLEQKYLSKKKEDLEDFLANDIQSEEGIN